MSFLMGFSVLPKAVSPSTPSTPESPVPARPPPVAAQPANGHRPGGVVTERCVATCFTRIGAALIQVLGEVTSQGLSVDQSELAVSEA